MKAAYYVSLRNKQNGGIIFIGLRWTQAGATRLGLKSARDGYEVIIEKKGEEE